MFITCLQIVDLGSGKGYLSTQLALNNKVTVVGVDAMATNTDGAVKRANIFGKQWKGLVNNAEELQSQGKVTKKSKKLKKRERHKEQNKQSEDKPSTTIQGQGDIFERTFASSVDDLSGELNMVDLDEFSALVTTDGDRVVEVCSDNSESSIVTCDEKPILTCNISDDSSDHCNSALNSNSKLPSDMDSPVNSKQTAVTNKSRKKLKEFNGLYHPITKFVDPSLKLFDVAMEAVSHSEYVTDRPNTTMSREGTPMLNSPREKTLLLTGLHTCGSLGSSMLELFVNNDEVKVLCYVGCCYHLMDEKFVVNPFTSDGKWNVINILTLTFQNIITEYITHINRTL